MSYVYVKEQSTVQTVHRQLSTELLWEINNIFSIFGEQFLISVNHVRIKSSFSSF